MAEPETPDEIAARLLENDDRRLRTPIMLASLSLTYEGDEEYAAAETYFDELLTAYRDEVRLRKKLEREASTGLYLSGARATLDENRRVDLFNSRRREWQFTRRELEEKSDAASKLASRYFLYQIAGATTLLTAVAVVALFFWRARSFYYEAGQAALWLAGGAIVLSPLFVLDFRAREHAALADRKRWAKMLDAGVEREGTVSG